MSKERKHKTCRVYQPRYWLAWLLVGIFYCLHCLPYRWQLQLGKYLGLLLHRFMPYAKKNAEINIKLCFPKYSQKQWDKLVCDSFISLGISIFETGLACWGSKKRLLPLLHYHNQHNLEAAKNLGRGVIILGSHQTSLQLVGRLMAFNQDYAVMYRPHKKAFVNFLLEHILYRHYSARFSRHDMRQIVKWLRQKGRLWFAGDVDVGQKNSVFAPFFGVAAATSVAPLILAKLNSTPIVPVAHYRREDGSGYDVYFGEAINQIPSGDDAKDAALLNQIIEQNIRLKPQQYLWQYQRFKTRPDHQARIYRKNSS